MLVLFCASICHGELPRVVEGFLERHCYECHDEDVKKAGLDLTGLSRGLGEREVFATWVKVFDRAVAGEMPPAKKKKRPGEDVLGVFEKELGGLLVEEDVGRIAKDGRAVQRRLNRYEYEETLRDLLGLPHLEVKGFLPEDPEAHGFNKVGDALDVSHVQLARYLQAGEAALRGALAPAAERPAVVKRRYYTWDERAFTGRVDLGGPLVRRTFPLVGTELQRQWMEKRGRGMRSSGDVERKGMEGMAVVVSTYEPTEIRFSKFEAPVTGRYRLRFSAQSIQMAADYKSAGPGLRSEPVIISADRDPRILRKLGSFDVGPEATEAEMEVWLFAGETIRPDAARLHRNRPPDHKNPDVGPDGMPGVSFRWMEVEGPLFEAWPPEGQRLMFGDLALLEGDDGVEVLPVDDEVDAERLMRGFLQRAYRREVSEDDVERFLGVVRGAMEQGFGFRDAMLAGYTAVLSSPGFLYFDEVPGRLGGRALASRLAYFLWNTAPDAELLSLADSGKLVEGEVLRGQVERMLGDGRSRVSVNAFLDYWLDLRSIAGTAPDVELYPDYQLDDLLVESMIEESQRFFVELLEKDLGAANLIDSNFTMLNGHLADHYGVPGVDGVAVKRVALPEGSVRGGLMTQASVLKVTANGTTTSPVMRGAWVMGRILGQESPPPPAAVAAVEPDIRGASTIREQLEKHRSQESCNACHRKIDPTGFALEAFDVMGGWRERYRSVGSGEPVAGIGNDGNRYRFKLGPAVDTAGVLWDGRKFGDIGDMKGLLLDDVEGVARNLVEKLVVYGTGAGVGFADREEVEKILDSVRVRGYGVRSIVHEIVQSDLFRNK